jgi:hypothetical protein
MKVVYQFFPNGTTSGRAVLSDDQYAKGFPAPTDGKVFLTFDYLLPESACFYDAETNSVLHMKLVEENGEFFEVIDHDKEPIYL